MSDYGRVVVLEIGLPGQVPRRIEARWDRPSLYITASVQRTAGGQDDTAEIAVAGLAPQTVAVLQSSGVVCRLRAGYGETLTTLCSGRVLPSTLQGPRRDDGSADWITSWSISDGGIDLRSTIVSASWSGEVSALQVLDVLIRQSGLARGSVELGRPHRWASGLTLAGTVREGLERVAGASESVIVVQDGAVQAWPIGAPRTTSAVRLSSSTTLIGTPEPADDGRYTVRSDLLGAVMPGDRVTVVSSTLNGPATVESISHEIDSTDGPYESILEVQP